MRILVIDADKSGVELVRHALLAGAYTIDVESDVAMAQQRALDRGYVVVLIGSLLELGDVLRLIALMRDSGATTPVLAFYARESVARAISMLDGGVDDVIDTADAGPLLAARVRAVIRRSTARTIAFLKFGSLELNRVSHRVTSDGVPVSLTARQYALLEYLVLSAHKTVLRSELLANVWQLQFDPGSNVVDVHVAQLRKRLRDAGSLIDVRTVRGEGYAIFEHGEGLGTGNGSQPLGMDGSTRPATVDGITGA